MAMQTPVFERQLLEKLSPLNSVSIRTLPVNKLIAVPP